MPIKGTLNVGQSIVDDRLTMQPHFRDFLLRVNDAVQVVEADVATAQATADAAAAAAASAGSAAASAGSAAASAAAAATAAEAVANWGGITGTLSAQTDLQSALDGKADNADLVYYPPVVADEGTDPYTLVLGDANTVKRFTTASAAVTIPTNASVAFPVGTEVSIRQAGTGTLVLTTASLTINGTVPGWAQHVEVKFRKVATDTWDVV